MKFSDLKPGDVFAYHEAVLAKIQSRPNFHGVALNAAVLVPGPIAWLIEGEWVSLEDSRDVTPLDVHFTARESNEGKAKS